MDDDAAVGLLIRLLGEHFRGLWAYTMYDHPRVFCASVLVNGALYDTGDHEDPEGALTEANMLVNKLKEESDPKGVR